MSSDTGLFWYQPTRKQRAVKQQCVCVCNYITTNVSKCNTLYDMAEIFGSVMHLSNCYLFIAKLDLSHHLGK